MPHHHAMARQRRGARGLHVILLPLGGRGAIGGAGEIGVLRRHQRDDQRHLPLPQHRHQHQRQQDGREGQLQIHHAHDRLLDPAAGIRRQDAERGAERHCHRPRRDAHLQGDPQAVEDRGEQVAPLRIGPEPMHIPARTHEARRAPRIAQVQIRQVVGILRRDPGRQQRGRDHQQDHGERDDRDPALPILAPERRHQTRPPRRSRGSSSA